METTDGTFGSLMITFVVIVGLMLAVLAWLAYRARRMNLAQTDSPDEKPAWMATTPPPETIAATQADGEGITLYDHDPGEMLAAPFAEQIEDIARAMLDADPDLAAMLIDFGTDLDGGLEIWLGDKRYSDVQSIPNERVQSIIRQAIVKYNEHHARQ